VDFCLKNSEPHGVVAGRRNGLLDFMSNRGGEVAHGGDAVRMDTLVHAGNFSAQDWEGSITTPAAALRPRCRRR
jgi:hypothetical protein